MKDNKTPDLNRFYKNTLITQLRTKPMTMPSYLANISVNTVKIQKTNKNSSSLLKKKNNNKNENSDTSLKLKKQNFVMSNHESQKSFKNKEIISKVSKKKKLQCSKSKCPSNKQLKFCYFIKKSSITNDRTDASLNSQTIDANNKKRKQLHKKKYKSQLMTEIDCCKDPNKQTIQVSKYDSTHINKSDLFKQQNTIEQPKIVVTAKKFRKGKYQLTNSSLTSKQFTKTVSKKCELSKSNNDTEAAMKQSNESIYKDNDLIEKRQINNFYSQLKNRKDRKIEMELEKTIQQYFGQESDCKVPKTNNGIEIFLSAVKRPPINRQFNLNAHCMPENQMSAIGQKLQNKETKLLVYDFDFLEQQLSMVRKPENSRPSDSPMTQNGEQNFLQLQRQKANKKHFQKFIKYVEQKEVFS